MASAAGVVTSSEDSGRRKPRLAASLQISPGPSSRRPPASLGREPWEPVLAPSAEDNEGDGQSQASAGDGGPWAGAGVKELGTARAWDGLGGRMRRSPKVSVPPRRARQGLPNGSWTAEPAAQRPPAGPGCGGARAVYGRPGRLPDLPRGPDGR